MTSREPSLAGKRAWYLEIRNDGGIDGNANFETDTIRRPTPVVIRKDIIDEVFGTYDMLDMSSIRAGMLPAEELKEGDGEVLKLEDFECLGCCIQGMPPIWYQRMTRKR